MTKKHVTTEMKWIDWNYLNGLASPLKEVVDVVYDRCQEMNLVDIMSFFATGMGKLWLNSMPHFILVNVEGSFSFLLEEKGSHTPWLSLVHCLVTLETKLVMVVDIL